MSPSKPTSSPPRAPSSFAKSLFLAEIHEEMVFPYPRLSDEEQATVEVTSRSVV